VRKSSTASTTMNRRQLNGSIGGFSFGVPRPPGSRPGGGGRPSGATGGRPLLSFGIRRSSAMGLTVGGPDQPVGLGRAISGPAQEFGAYEVVEIAVKDSLDVS
jgi:hypothetical protein